MSDDSFLREVEEELRSEKLKAFWRRYAPFIIGGAVLIVLLVAANEGWKWWQTTTANSASESYYAALDLAEDGDLDGAQVAFQQIAAEGPDGYGTLARFQIAGLLAEQGDAEAALAAYDELASTLDNPRLREVALVSAAYIAVDNADVAAVEMRVGGLTGEESTLRNQAREAIGLAHYRAEDYEAARTQFEAIAGDANASQDVQMRAYLYLEQLAALGTDGPDAAQAPGAQMGVDVFEELGDPLAGTEDAVEPEGSTDASQQ
ncbi:tetratricopeptide repeat protein [Pelagibacterium montanilacus]|uniref:tetratricopeptide repeat protein n=1 Tax=Pelagibacterium montanilacus TaxID=2185280 RepID=UPI000F8C4C84|nr:tetratricopeptide repeat protein [Pelagibacterium montanilacus]